ncbi:HipA domain-containing protein, partial [mine drainage metagenome]
RRKSNEGSYEMIARAVEIFAGDDSVVQLKKLFERVVFSCWMRDGDAHLKNFGMLYEHPSAARRLAPIYDVVCTDVYPELDGKLALKFNKSKVFPAKEDIVGYGNRLGLDDGEVAEVLGRIEDACDTVMSRFKKDHRYQSDSLLADLQKAIER